MWQRRSAQATVIGSIAAVATLALAIALPLGWFSSSSSPGHIRAEQLLVLESNHSSRQQVQATVLNTGGTTVLIKSALLRILRVYTVPVCYSQGEIPLSGSYEAVLPQSVGRGPGSVVTVPLHDEARPGGSDRFAVSLSVAKSPKKTYTARLYQIALSIISGSGGNITSIGDFLVSLPYPLAPGEQYWTNELASASRSQLIGYFGGNIGHILHCYRTNAARLKHSLRLRGVRGVGLQRVGQELRMPPASLFPRRDQAAGSRPTS
jgi:hypothetical protein